MCEQEADRIADQVMATSTHQVISDTPPRIQRVGGQPIGQEDTAPSSVDQVFATPGRPLEPALRQDMEQRFGHNFSRVRVHSDVDAIESARVLNAQAFTVGHHIVFGPGRYAPQTVSGKKLLAHELTHVIQQNEQTDHGKSIQRKPEICQDLPEVCLKGTPEIYAISIPDIITVGREDEALLSASQFDEKLNPKGDNPVDYRWSVKLVDPQHTIQVIEVNKDPLFHDDGYVRLKGLKQGQASTLRLK
jgi:hypothetical protein